MGVNLPLSLIGD